MKPVMRGILTPDRAHIFRQKSTKRWIVTHLVMHGDKRTGVCYHPFDTWQEAWDFVEQQ